MVQDTFKYRKENFGELPVQLNHLTIYLNFLDEYIEATNCLDLTAHFTLNSIELDAKELTIVSVEWTEVSEDSNASRALLYKYNSDQNKLIVELPKQVQAGERFRIRTVTRCIPSDHILEGIYKDSTPPGAPQQYISQCQQWGFQRIMPIFDDCRAKCTMTTTMEASAAYTHLISNGNVSRKHNPTGKPVPKPGDPSRQIITYENPVPMAPYLFIAAAGTWDTLADHVTYGSGRTVGLEYLVPPGRTLNAVIPMEILKQAVLWVEKTQGYEYTGDTYRTITMNKSNFGGMENVGNTTIVTDAALIDDHTLDQLLMYAHAVIVHEFEHNQCGSETTMETPFDVWLNEAYTVDVERMFMADVFDSVFVRLTQIDSIRNPLLGPLAVEDAGYAGRIVREGFNDPDELIDAVTYVKAAEVIRMLRMILGKEAFNRGKELYFNLYKHSNANTDQFFACFEEVSGRSLSRFKENWLYHIGYPTVTAVPHYDPDTRTFTIRFQQESSVPGNFQLPIEVALVGKDGQDISGTQTVFELSQQTDSLMFPNLPEEPAFASLNRSYSFYGVLKEQEVNTDRLRLQARIDPNLFNRVEAVRRLTDRQRIMLLNDPDAKVDSDWLHLYGELLQESSVSPGLKAFFLRIDEQPLNREYAAWYRELVTARQSLMSSVTKSFKPDLVKSFLDVDTYGERHSPKDGIEERILKHVLLDLVAVDDSPESHDLILDHFRKATTAQDKVSALTVLNRSSAPQRREILESIYQAWHPHISGYANYLRIVASGTREDVFEMIEQEKKRPTFNITNPTWCRALFLTMAANTKMIWTDVGIDWITNVIIEFAAFNPFVASRLLNVFQHVKKLKPDLRILVESALRRIVSEVSETVSPTIHGQASAYMSEVQ
ncbi:M1 family metallopeptidase [Desulfomonile tiedjei]|uniref:Aminopeptidase N n=1 Tax=Desulfomonile tiedjei (strain ATCC 49306 / DSM 6799 / DCB-1) TaxID=706587 RepID=I4C3J0_DESTA|nr:M1 family metallopeptidase [Desulfomonile tiedjei]AFM24131.1 aminopeptidase N [Desulfomonile tiedjei DSM 6799]